MEDPVTFYTPSYKKYINLWETKLYKYFNESTLFSRQINVR